MPIVGQIALASCIIFTSVSSTVILSVVCYTYVTSIRLIGIDFSRQLGQHRYPDSYQELFYYFIIACKPVSLVSYDFS
jgi:hypothetical protein